MSGWVPDCSVKLNGSELAPEDNAHLQIIVVDLRRQAPGSVELQFNNHAGKYDEHKKLGPGTVVKVDLGYQQAGKSTVFEGEIIGNVVRVQENGPRLFSARAFDYLHRLTRGRVTKTYLEAKFSEIVKQVASRHGLSSDVSDTGFVREYVIQHNQTDLDFVRGIAGWLDYDLRIDSAKKLKFVKPNVGSSPAAKTVYEKANVDAGEIPLRRFDGRLSLARVVSEVIVRGWDPKTKKEIVGKAANAKLYAKMGGKDTGPKSVQSAWGATERQLVDYKVFSQDEADRIALTKLNEYARSFIRADIEVQGAPDLAPGQVIEVKRVGPRFDGPYFIEAVQHRFSSPVGADGGFVTKIKAARCAW